ncbi:OpgC domain-containing protein [Ponticoccus litoralis]|uniref:OpgC domain-containing protein n=1 Tax=Ponticoccus litoralis TaxID=422297 RepID=A0AAW9SBQ4_9RHOB
MSRPDPLSAVRRPRDPRIDAFRGLALAMIFIDHVPGNPYEAWTLRNWGFSDAAEAFFVMSGVAAGIAYSARFETRDQTGLWPAMAPLWSRALDAVHGADAADGRDHRDLRRRRRALRHARTADQA